MGTENEGPGKLLAKNQIERIIGSYVGENKLFEKMYLSG
jgi:acyl CoA:acetate/3-ketoacid CoA transferase alpha subunit